VDPGLLQFVGVSEPTKLIQQLHAKFTSLAFDDTNGSIRLPVYHGMQDIPQEEEDRNMRYIRIGAHVELGARDLRALCALRLSKHDVVGIFPRYHALRPTLSDFWTTLVLMLMFIGRSVPNLSASLLQCSPLSMWNYRSRHIEIVKNPSNADELDVRMALWCRDSVLHEHRVGWRRLWHRLGELATEQLCDLSALWRFTVWVLLLVLLVIPYRVHGETTLRMVPYGAAVSLLLVLLNYVSADHVWVTLYALVYIIPLQMTFVVAELLYEVLPRTSYIVLATLGLVLGLCVRIPSTSCSSDVPRCDGHRRRRSSISSSSSNVLGGWQQVAILVFIKWTRYV